MKDTNKTKETNEAKLEDAFRKLSAICQKDGQDQAEAFSLRAKCNYHFGDFQRALYDFSVAIRILERKQDDKDKK